MSKIPEMIEVVRFVCSACGKKSNSVAKNNKMKCGNCQEPYERKLKSWMPESFWKIKK